jgi:hypothetical protein
VPDQDTEAAQRKPAAVQVEQINPVVVGEVSLYSVAVLVEQV